MNSSQSLTVKNLDKMQIDLEKTIVDFSTQYKGNLDPTIEALVKCLKYVQETLTLNLKFSHNCLMDKIEKLNEICGNTWKTHEDEMKRQGKNIQDLSEFKEKTTELIDMQQREISVVSDDFRDYKEYINDKISIIDRNDTENFENIESIKNNLQKEANQKMNWSKKIEAQFNEFDNKTNRRANDIERNIEEFKMQLENNNRCLDETKKNLNCFDAKLDGKIQETKSKIQELESKYSFLELRILEVENRPNIIQKSGLDSLELDK